MYEGRYGKQRRGFLYLRKVAECRLSEIGQAKIMQGLRNSRDLDGFSASSERRRRDHGTCSSLFFPDREAPATLPCPSNAEICE